jgi:hypothetical protein
MEKEFVTYDLALRMKALGFDEPCFMYWWKGENGYILADLIDGEARTNDFKAPLYQQAFRWFREKYKLSPIISQFGYSIEDQFGQIIYTIPDDENPLCYEEAEAACLEKLIEIVEGIES